MKQVLGTLVYDTDKEEGDIEIDWSKMPTGLMMLDVINDWYWSVSDLYRQKEQEVFPKQ
jgi:hypothetical protein